MVEPITYEDEELVEQCEPREVVFRRYQDANKMIRNANNMMRRNIIKNMVEEVLACNGLNVCLHRPNYSSPFPDYIRQAETPRGCKVPKSTKIVGETNDLKQRLATFPIMKG